MQYSFLHTTSEQIRVNVYIYRYPPLSFPRESQISQIFSWCKSVLFQILLDMIYCIKSTVSLLQLTPSLCLVEAVIKVCVAQESVPSSLRGLIRSDIYFFWYETQMCAVKPKTIGRAILLFFPVDRGKAVLPTQN